VQYRHFSPSPQTLEDWPGLARYGATVVECHGPVHGKPGLVEVRAAGQVAWVPRRELGEVARPLPVRPRSRELTILRLLSEGPAFYRHICAALVREGFSGDHMSVSRAISLLLDCPTGPATHYLDHGVRREIRRKGLITRRGRRGRFLYSLTARGIRLLRWLVAV
jgi:DNA-binding transcriptional ArsR family regulator